MVPREWDHSRWNEVVCTASGVVCERDVADLPLLFAGSCRFLALACVDPLGCYLQLLQSNRLSRSGGVGGRRSETEGLSASYGTKRSPVVVSSPLADVRSFLASLRRRPKAYTDALVRLALRTDPRTGALGLRLARAREEGALGPVVGRTDVGVVSATARYLVVLRVTVVVVTALASQAA